MAVDFNTFLTVAPHVLDARLPILLRGRHGVGKSQVVYQIADTRELPVVERRASQMTEGDLLGLPDTADTEINGRKATTWNAPDWLVASMAHNIKWVKWTPPSLTAGRSSMLSLLLKIGSSGPTKGST